MWKAEFEISVKAPVDMVFSFVADVATRKKYVEFCKQVSYVTEERRGVGVEFIEVRKQLLRRMEIKSRVTEFILKEKVAWQNFHDGTLHSEVIYEFERMADGTNVRQIVIGHASELEQNAGRFLESERTLGNLRLLLEQKDTEPDPSLLKKEALIGRMVLDSKGEKVGVVIEVTTHNFGHSIIIDSESELGEIVVPWRFIEEVSDVILLNTTLDDEDQTD